MAKKLKKKSNGMNPKVKFTLVNAGKGIISNQCVIDGSKESPWWVAAIFLAVSVILPLIPNYVKVSKTKGSDFISSVNYGFDTALTDLAYSMEKNEEELKVEGGLLHYYKHGTQYDDYAFVTPDDTYIEDVKQEAEVIDSSNDQYSLRVFMWKGISGTTLQKYVNKVAKQQFKIGTHNIKNTDTDPEGTKYYTPSIMILTPKTMAVALYKNDTTSQVSTTYGGMDWLNTGKTGLIERLNKAGLEDGAFTDPSMTRDTYITKYRAKVLNQFARICNEAYLNQKTRTKWANTGIYAGIYTGVIVFLGLMLFILTRGKNNPFRYLNVWHTQKIAWWAAFTPAVLGMILAFVFSGNMIGQMAFILLISLRVMWMSMKQLRPQIQQ